MSPLNDYQHIAENTYNHPLITDNFNTRMEDHYSLALDSLRRREHTLAQKSLETSLNTLTVFDFMSLIQCTICFLELPSMSLSFGLRMYLARAN